MTFVDLPGQDAAVQAIPEDMLADIATRASGDLYTFATILGFTKVRPGAHGPVCTFINHNPARFKLIMMPRDHFKTSLVTISGSLQKIVQNPEHRLLIANENATNAERFLRAIRQIAEKNRIFRTMFSSIIPKDIRKVRWNDSELDFNRQGFYPEPSIDTIGMTGTMTSRHYTHMTFDDPISEEALKSEKVMKDTIDRMSSIMALLVEPNHDSWWLVGTRWAFHDVYSHMMKVYGPQLARLIRAAIEDGEPIFPELLSLETLGLIRQTMTEYKFSCLYMNNPRNPDVQDLNVDDVLWWRWHPDEVHIELYGVDGGIKRTVHLEDLDITTTVDLAPAETDSSDRNAVVTSGVTKWGEVVVLEAWAKRCNPLELIEKLFEVNRVWKPRCIGIEGVAYQKAFKWFFKAEMERRQTYVRIEELKAVGKKEYRIRGLQPIIATRRLFMNPTQLLLRQEMADFPLGEHDDVVDCLSMQQQLWRGFVSPERMAKMKDLEDSIIQRILGPRADVDTVDEELFNPPRQSWSEVVIPHR